MDAHLEITGMHCGSCAALIEETLADDPGVSHVEVDLEAARAVVRFDPEQSSTEALCAAVAELGYGAVAAAGPPRPGAAADTRRGDPGSGREG